MSEDRDVEVAGRVEEGAGQAGKGARHLGSARHQGWHLGVLPGCEGLAGEGNDPERARLVSLQAQEAFEEQDVPWAGDYQALMSERWDWYGDAPDWWRWRVAAYVAWASVPREVRRPRTHQELASLLGLRSARTIRKWRAKYPEIDALVTENILEPLLERRAEVLEALMESAASPDYKNFRDRELYLKVTRIYVPRQEVGMEVNASAVNADEMGRRQAAAEAEVSEWEGERFGALAEGEEEKKGEDDGEES